MEASGDANQSTSSGNAESWLPFSYVRSLNPQKISNTEVGDSWEYIQWDYHFEKAIWISWKCKLRNFHWHHSENLTYKKENKAQMNTRNYAGHYQQQQFLTVNRAPKRPNTYRTRRVGVYNTVSHTLTLLKKVALLSDTQYCYKWDREQVQSMHSMTP